MIVQKFNAKLTAINDWLIIRLPLEVSAQMPSKGLCMADVTVHDISFKAPLEPDGQGSHWLRLSDNTAKSAGLSIGDDVDVLLEPTKDWPEPDVPTDIANALAKEPSVHALWDNVTPMARWDWIRWIRSTHNDDTRKKRIDVAFDKLRKGTKRPCCFNRTVCTEPHVSKSGILLSSE